MSNYLNPNTWRSRTVSGIPFRFVDMDGNVGGDGGRGFVRDKAEVDAEYLVPAGQLVAFLNDIFPPPIQLGDLQLEQLSSLPGFSALKAVNATFKGHIDGKPIDPFGADPTAPVGTYQTVTVVVVHYKSLPTPDINDPQTFLEISSNASGQYLNIKNAVGGWTVSSGFTDETFQTSTVNQATKDPQLPITIPVPMTDWTIKWPRLDAKYFDTQLINLLRSMIGRVNSEKFALTYNSLRETLMFKGWSHSEQWTWRGILPPTVANLNRKTVSLTLKFTEKHINYGNGLVATHNHFWRKNVGWQRLFIGTNSDGFRYPFELVDFNRIFMLDTTTTTTTTTAAP